MNALFVFGLIAALALLAFATLGGTGTTSKRGALGEAFGLGTVAGTNANEQRKGRVSTNVCDGRLS